MGVFVLVVVGKDDDGDLRCRIFQGWMELMALMTRVVVTAVVEAVIRCREPGGFFGGRRTSSVIVCV